jgi:hypothetical protein
MRPKLEKKLCYPKKEGNFWHLERKEKNLPKNYLKILSCAIGPCLQEKLRFIQCWIVRGIIWGILFCRQLQHLVTKITYNVCLWTQISQFSKKKNPMLFGLLATALSPLELTLYNSMLALLAILKFLLSHSSSNLMIFLRMKIKYFYIFIFLKDFNSIPNIIPKTST